MKLIIVCLCLIILVCPQRQAIAAESGQTDDRSSAALRVDNSLTAEEQQKESEKNLKHKKEDQTKEPSFLFGGSFTSSYRYYKNLDNIEAEEDFLKWSWRQDLYLWAYYHYKDTVTVYARVYNSYVDRGVGQTYTGIGADYEGPALNALLVNINLNKISPIPGALTLGRQSLRVGRGVVYSDINDGAQAELVMGNLHFKFFGAKSRPREDNIDFSVPGFDKEGDRVFWGHETAYTGIPKTTVYGFALVQNDQSSENTDRPQQSFHYNSHYLGTGFTSKLGANELWAEGSLERGETFTDASQTTLPKSKIKAWDALAGVKHRSTGFLKPVYETEFAAGTGDEDRLSVTNVLGGNTDAVDKNFLYFGSYAAGYALQPQLSNIMIWTLGASCQPLENVKMFKDFAIGSKHYFYWKDQKRGLISDLESSGTETYVGEEWDFYMHWKVNEQLRWILRYGVFIPSDGYPATSRDDTEYFFLSTTYSF